VKPPPVGPARRVADHDIAACFQQGGRDTVLAEGVERALQNKTLRDAAKVEAHPGDRQAHGHG
jgi:hypothetical protein